MEVTQGQLAQGAIDRLAVTATGKVRLGDRSPVIALLEDCQDVVRILVGFEVENERRITQGAEGGGGEDRAFQSVGCALAQDDPRRPGGVGEMIRHLIEETLDTDRAFQGAQTAAFGWRQHWRKRSTLNVQGSTLNCAFRAARQFRE